MIDKKMIDWVMVYIVIACAVAVGVTMWNNAHKANVLHECSECEHEH